MWDGARCDFCGDCLVRCQYVDYDKEEAIQQIKELVAGKPALSLCVMEPFVPGDAVSGQMFEEMIVARGGRYFCLSHPNALGSIV